GCAPKPASVVYRTVTTPADPPTRSTVIVAPPSLSRTGGAHANPRLPADATSLSVIVRTASYGVARADPGLGLSKYTWTVSFPSTSVSSVIGIVNVFGAVSPS